MTLSITTPALLFSATSLILLAYTNRFLTVAGVIRELRKEYDKGNRRRIPEQIENLSRRVILIKYMQLMGISSLFASVFSMYLVYHQWAKLGEYMFGLSMILMLISLGLCAWEINISVNALQLNMSGMEGFKDKKH